MDSSTKALIIIILVAILAILLTFVLSRLLLKRALMVIIGKLRDSNALDAPRAMLAHDLGINKSGLMTFRLWRDYKPMALDILIKANIVQLTEDGRIFLSEEMLAQTNLGQKKNKGY
jgi:hypothetical protein